MKQPEISVIVPVYNAGKYLCRCVDSILAQTFTDFELLLIDDGSKDSSSAICDEYASADSRVRVYHKPNGGVSSARNLGLDNARGKWIAFADADDYVSDAWLADLLSLKTTDADLMVCGFWQIHEAGKVECKGESFIGDNRAFVEKMMPSGMIGTLWNKLFRKSIIDEKTLRFSENLIFREDEEFFFRYIVSARVCASVKTANYYYNQPSWHKYSSQWGSVSSFYLIASIYTSCKILKLDESILKKLRKELDKLLIFSIRKTPLQSLRHLRTYKCAIFGTI